jgi:proton-coupled amino acid transporter
LSLYPLINVYQAGEDLEELEEDEEEEEEAIDEDRRAYDQPSGSQDTGPEAAQGSLARILAESQPPKSAVSETSPLLPRARGSSLQRSRTRRRRATVSHGDATVGQAVLMVCHD